MALIICHNKKEARVNPIHFYKKYGNTGRKDTDCKKKAKIFCIL